MSVTLNVTNHLGVPGTFYIKFDDTADMATKILSIDKNIHLKKSNDSLSGGKSTIFADVPPEGTVSLYVDKEYNITNGKMWFVQNEHKNTIDKFESEPKITRLDFNLDTNVSFKIDNSNGINCGIKTTWMPNSGEIVTVDSAPFTLSLAPEKLRKTNKNHADSGFFSNKTALVSDSRRKTDEIIEGVKYTKEANELADCDTSSACRINACRRFVKNIASETGVSEHETYCGWLKNGGSQSHCWKHDNLTCTDETCGYAEHYGFNSLYSYGQPFYSTDPNSKPAIGGGKIKPLMSHLCLEELMENGIFSSGGIFSNVTDFSCGVKENIDVEKGGIVFENGISRIKGTISPFMTPGLFDPGVNSTNSNFAINTIFDKSKHEDKLWWWKTEGPIGKQYGCSRTIINESSIYPSNPRIDGSIYIDFNDISYILTGIKNENDRNFGKKDFLDDIINLNPNNASITGADDETLSYGYLIRSKVGTILITILSILFFYILTYKYDSESTGSSVTGLVILCVIFILGLIVSKDLIFGY